LVLLWGASYLDGRVAFWAEATGLTEASALPRPALTERRSKVWYVRPVDIVGFDLLFNHAAAPVVSPHDRPFCILARCEFLPAARWSTPDLRLGENNPNTP
jgi:hypothetical protein